METSRFDVLKYGIRVANRSGDHSAKELLAETGDYDPTTPCWEWVGATFFYGYGNLGITLWDRTHHNIGAHVIAWMALNGDVPEGHRVLHYCDNPPCTRPSHLHSGSQQENILECRDRGRMNRARPIGEKNNSAKLTEAQVLAILAVQRHRGYASELAAQYGITRGHVMNLRAGRAWSHLPRAEAPS